VLLQSHGRGTVADEGRIILHGRLTVRQPRRAGLTDVSPTSMPVHLDCTTGTLCHVENGDHAACSRPGDSGVQQPPSDAVALLLKTYKECGEAGEGVDRYAGRLGPAAGESLVCFIHGDYRDVADSSPVDFGNPRALLVVAGYELLDRKRQRPLQRIVGAGLLTRQYLG
jgi:hypothetical protein